MRSSRSRGGPGSRKLPEGRQAAHLHAWPRPGRPRPRLRHHRHGRRRTGGVVVTRRPRRHPARRLHHPRRLGNIVVAGSAFEIHARARDRRGAWAISWLGHCPAGGWRKASWARPKDAGPSWKPLMAANRSTSAEAIEDRRQGAELSPTTRAPSAIIFKAMAFTTPSPPAANWYCQQLRLWVESGDPAPSSAGRGDGRPIDPRPG